MRLLDGALAANVGEERAFLESVCGDDSALLRDALHLLEDGLREGAPFDEPAAARAAPLVLALESDLAPSSTARLGPWRLLHELGRGGMGTVYLAERADEAFEQTVAIKVVRGALALDDQIIARFRDERRILAALEHPNIARVLDGGVTKEGLPWFAMELVEGQPITEYAQAEQLGFEARVRLFLTACDAVQFAHQKLVVHCDLKPGNLLVSDSGHVKLLDFGIAQLLPEASNVYARGDSQHASAALTTGLRLTPAYASPEQRLDGQVSVSNDVYALGVILYELLTGRLPHTSLDSSLREQAQPQAIVEKAATRPSDVPGVLAASLRGDIDAILLKALRRDPRERYASVAAFADDLRNHLAVLPVSARGSSRGYLAHVFARRHRGALAATTLLLIALCIGVGGTVQQSRRANRERDRAHEQAMRATGVASFLTNLLFLSDPNRALGSSISMAAAVDSAADWLARELQDAPVAHADVALVLAELYGAMGQVDRHRALADSALRVQQREWGPEDPRLVPALLSVTEAMRGAGELRNAEPQLRLALRLARLDTAPTTSVIDHALNLLALSLRDQGRASEGESLLREVMTASRGSAERNPVALHRTLTNLGHLLLAQQRFAEAESLYREVLSLRQSYWGPSHPEVANALVNVALVLGRQGKLIESEQWYRDGLDMRRHTQGDTHSEIGIDLFAFATVYHQFGKHREAADTYREAHRRLVASLGASHPVARAAADSLRSLAR